GRFLTRTSNRSAKPEREFFSPREDMSPAARRASARWRRRRDRARHPGRPLRPAPACASRASAPRRPSASAYARRDGCLAALAEGEIPTDADLPIADERVLAPELVPGFLPGGKRPLVILAGLPLGFEPCFGEDDVLVHRAALVRGLMGVLRHR